VRVLEGKKSSEQAVGVAVNAEKSVTVAALAAARLMRWVTKTDSNNPDVDRSPHHLATSRTQLHARGEMSLITHVLFIAISRKNDETRIAI